MHTTTDEEGIYQLKDRNGLNRLYYCPSAVLSMEKGIRSRIKNRFLDRIRVLLNPWTEELHDLARMEGRKEDGGWCGRAKGRHLYDDPLHVCDERSRWIHGGCARQVDRAASTRVGDERYVTACSASCCCSCCFCRNAFILSFCSNFGSLKNYIYPLQY